jgi:E3 ubiquitin-protein ligase UBR2
MEAFSRCLYEHAEYEQEWESAFYLHCKMAFVISLMHEWCGEDKVVLIKAYK